MCETGFPPEDPTASPTPEPVAAVRQFCPCCGTRWQPDWTACPACAQDAASAAAKPAHSGPGVGAAVVLYCLCLLQVVLTWAIADQQGDVEEPAHYAAVVIVSDVLFAAIAVVGGVWFFRAVWPALRRGAHPKWLLAGALSAIPSVLLASVAVNWLSERLGLEELSYSEPLLAAGWSWWAIILSTAVQPALFEELVFRGAMLPGLGSALSVRDAILVSGMCFATMHLSPLMFPVLALLGIWFGWLRVKTGSLYPSMVAHFCHNALVLALEAGSL